MASRSQKIMFQPIAREAVGPSFGRNALSLIFRYLQNKTRVSIWVYDNKDIRFEGIILGFDEFMNVVLGDAVEISIKKGTRTEHGRILLKGDSITLVTGAKASEEDPEASMPMED